MTGTIQISAYCNYWHSCCSAVELWAKVEMLLDFSSNRKLMLFLWQTITLENKHIRSANPIDLFNYWTHNLYLDLVCVDVELTLTQGWSSTCTAVYLWSITTCSIPLIRAYRWVCYTLNIINNTDTHHDLTWLTVMFKMENNCGKFKQPWQSQTHCPSMVQENQADPSKFVWKGPPGLLQY